LKNLFTIALAIVGLTVLAPASQATIDWAGNAYPNDGHVTTPTGEQFVVAQVYKSGTTDGAGQGPDIEAVLVYQTDLMAMPAEVAMSYNTDVGNNDEYIGFIPQMDIAGSSTIEVNVVFTDLADATEFGITGDQNGNPAPLLYTVSDVLPVDVTVTFTLCMSGAETVGAPCVIGSAAEIGAWGTGVPMTNVSGELWTVDVTFPAGSAPAFEYKFKKDDCNTWEGTGNRLVTLPTDGTASVVRDTDSWEFLPIGCGIGEVLANDVEICFSLCLGDVESIGDVCVIGNLPELSAWTTGVALTSAGQGIWEGCITIPAGSPYPINMAYKFKKDNCETWESVGDRVLLIDDSTSTSVLLEHTFDDNSGTCEPVSDDESSFGAIKARFQK